MTTVILTSGTSWTVPTGVTTLTLVECWGPGGGGGGVWGSDPVGSASGGSGGYSSQTAISVTPGQVITYQLGTPGAGGLVTSNVSYAGGNGTSTWFGGTSQSTSNCAANGGGGGSPGSVNPSIGGAGATTTGAIGSTTLSGAAGAGDISAPPITGGSAGAPGPGGAAGAGQVGTNTTSGAGGTANGGAVAGGVGVTTLQGNAGTSNANGGSGASASMTGNGVAGGSPGAGGSGSQANDGVNANGGVGGGSQIRITYTAGSGVPGSLSGSNAVATGDTNLSSPVQTDWIQFPASTTSGVYNTRSGGGATISVPIGIGPDASVANASSTTGRGVTWTDGTPNATGTSNQQFIYSPTASGPSANGDGMQFTLPADTSVRTATIVWSAYGGGGSVGATATLVATLSDGSAAPLTLSPVTPGVNGTGNYVATITYNASTSGQTLTVAMALATNGSNTYAEVWMQAASYLVMPTGATHVATICIMT